MENRTLLTRLGPVISAVFVVVVAATMRLLPHPPNVTPIGGLALFSGAHLNKRGAVLFPLLAMFVSDFFLGFHSAMVFVYASFVLIFFIGKLLGDKKEFSRLLIASVSSSLLFYLVTNFGVWLTTNLYEKSMSGLLNAYIMGLPFLRNTALGDLIYSSVFFYGWFYLSSLLLRARFLFLSSKSS